jgi:PAS domain-containing protein
MSLVQDITERKEAEEQKAFDRDNLKALLNNTEDLIWSVDRDFRLITSNYAFDEMVKWMSGNTVTKGSDVLAPGFSEQQLVRFKKLYERAFSGESFTETEFIESPVDLWSEISFYPIYREKGVVGTA